ncbi:MAG: MBL fold metallo-hydrolase, partial [Oscillospiraceae bacterium]|nr:MBL fold metallo-hydrolase [Oscillospiraceae bacterium]
DAPFSGTEYDLIAGEYTNITQGVVLKKKAAKPQDTAFEKLVAAAERLLRVAKECKGLTNKSLNRFSSQIDSLIDKMKNERNF